MPDSRVRVLVIRAEVDWAIAKECWKLARTSGSQNLTTNWRVTSAERARSLF